MYVDLNKELTAEEQSVKEETHKFAAEVLRPASIELDSLSPEDVIAEGSVHWEVFRKAYQQGYHSSTLPEQLGGADLSTLSRHIHAEEMGWGSADFAISIGVTAFPFTFAAMSGNQDLIKNVVVPFAEDREGKYIGCWAITKPHHGSDSLLIGTEQFGDAKMAFECAARPDGDEWVINGQKAAWVSNGTIATHACTFLSIDSSKGMAGGGVAIIPLDLPGVSHCKPRVQGGKPIAEHQLVQKKLFDMFIKVESARSLSRAAMTYNAATNPPATQYSIAAKVYCTEAAFEVASDAIQLFGGYGLARDLPVEKLFRDARASMIEDGTNEGLSLAGARKLIDT